MIHRNYRTDPRRIEARIDELFYLDNAYRRGFYAGYLQGIRFMTGEDPRGIMKEPRSPMARLMKHYERQLKRAIKKGARP